MSTKTNIETGHTPGPWVVLEGRNAADSPIQIESVERYAICDVRTFSGFDENEANARLIAASPDLLEALLDCEKDVIGGDIPDLEMIRAAISKATGK